MGKRKREDKLMRAAHIKRHTVGTSNEISFSVLDAAKNQLGTGADDKGKGAPRPSRISLFTLPFRGKRPAATPVKEPGLPLPGGGFVSADKPGPGVGVGLPASRNPDARTPAPRKQDVPATMASVKNKGWSSSQSGVSSDRVATAAGSATAAFPASSGSSFASSLRAAEEKVASRKLRRRRHRRLAVAFAVVVTTGAIAMGGTYLYQDNQAHLTQVGQLNDALSLIGSADDTFVALDEAVNDPFGDGADDAYQDVSSRMGEATASLDKAEDMLSSISDEMNESTDKDVARQALATITARRTLADKGMQLLDEASDARKAAAQLKDAWQQVLDADSLARDAAQMVTDTTDEHINASKEKTEQSSTAFGKARDSLAVVATQYPQADLTSLVSYVDKRIESLGYAVASDDAFLARDKATAEAQNDAYNVADAQAAALAEKIPSDPTDLVHDGYDQAVSGNVQEYSTARLQAGSADAFIRDYLGAGFK